MSVRVGPSASSVSARRCLLFVPGARPERFAKAFAAGADMVCIDWEDATPLDQKLQARAATLEFLAQPQAAEAVIRINSLRTADGLADLLSIAQGQFSQAPLVMVAKCESAPDLEIAASVLQERCSGLIALLESPHAIEQAFAISKAPKLLAMMLGGADYCAELSVPLNARALHYPRSRIAGAAASAGLLAIDVPFLGTQADSQTLLDLQVETRLAQSLGLHGKSAIHPNQVEVIQSTLSPSADEIHHASALLAAFHASPHAAIRFDGKLVDRPLILAAEAILRRGSKSSIK